jgi:hypothetical protein
MKDHLTKRKTKQFMKQRRLKPRLPTRNIACLWLCLLLTGLAAAQGWTDWLGVEGGPRMRAALVDEAQNARNHSAVVEVQVLRIWLHSPQALGASSVTTGRLWYRVDQGPVIATTDTQLTFEQLTPGDHSIKVTVVGIDDHPLTPSAKLTVRIP